MNDSKPCEAFGALVPTSDNRFICGLAHDPSKRYYVCEKCCGDPQILEGVVGIDYECALREAARVRWAL